MQLRIFIQRLYLEPLPGNMGGATVLTEVEIFELNNLYQRQCFIDGSKLLGWDVSWRVPRFVQFDLPGEQFGFHLAHPLPQSCH